MQVSTPDTISPFSLSPHLPAHDPEPLPGVITPPLERDRHDFGDWAWGRTGIVHDEPADMDGPRVDTFGDWGILDTQPATHSEDTTQQQELTNTDYLPEHVDQGHLIGEVTTPRTSKPFHRWMRTLHKRAARRQGIRTCEDHITYSLEPEGRPSFGVSTHHRKSESGSSFRFVRAVRSASLSITSASVLTRSRRTTTQLSSRAYSRTDRSSRASVSGARISEDSFGPERQAVIDPAVIERSLQRRRILEELISTEENYIGDVRFLMNVYVTILASLPTLPPGLRASINRNLTDIVELHEEMLGDLHRVVPFSEYTQPELPSLVPQSGQTMGHHRWRSLNAVPEDRGGISWLQSVPGVLAEPQTAAEVAKVFSKKMNRFFIYEEYGAKYELMIKDVASAHRTMPKWQSYQRGLEVLASSLGSANSFDDSSKKSLTIGDLLVKPIQRVCKYPLLFAELLKHTPVVDCPYSHMEIENTLIRLREATAEINRATNDARVKSVLEKTWILQDRLVFPNQQLDAVSKNRVRALGHIQLCGALHVCWQTKEGVTGQYMVALLYREWLCLATASRCDQIYTIQACLALSNIKLEEVDNGRGLQCHTAPYSWKMVFICDHQLYEVILTACTPKEEMEWCSRLSSGQDAIGGQDQEQTAAFSFLSLNLKSLGTVFRKPGTIARRISIHRATTVGPKSPLCQVILKNTSVMKDAAPSSGAGSQINRSQSLLTTTARIPVLAPARGERARLEALLSDVWTRDVLPFPGITARSRSEHLVRASASSVMRKLSVVSIASSFSKRSASLASLQQKASADTEEAAVARDASPAVVPEEESEPPAPAAATGSRSLLSVIPDEEAEQRRSVSLRTVDTAAADWRSDDVLHPPQADEMRRGSDGDATLCAAASSAGVLQTSANSSQHGSVDSFGGSGGGGSVVKVVTKTSAAPARGEKENISARSSPVVKKHSSYATTTGARGARRLSSKWGGTRRVGGGGLQRRETVVESIRGFFR